MFRKRIRFEKEELITLHKILSYVYERNDNRPELTELESRDALTLRMRIKEELDKFE